MADEKEELILGIWTQEEFLDDLLFGLFVALMGFFTTLLYKYITKCLEQHKIMER